jgi:hypothetical protein
MTTPTPTPIGATETKMLQALQGASGGPELLIVADDAEPAVRGIFLRWFVQAASAAGTFARVVLWRATCPDGLSLQGMTLGCTPCFAHCRFDAKLDATDAHVVGLEVIAGSLPSLVADRLTASGSVLVRGTIAATGAPYEMPDAPLVVARSVYLSGAQIRGNLDLRGSRLGAQLAEGPQAVCFLADGLTVSGNVLFADGFHATGEVRLNGCTIGRNLDLSGARMENRGSHCLSLAGGTVHGSIYATRRGNGPVFTAVGTVRLEGAHIDGDLNARGAQLTATAFAGAAFVPAEGRDGDLVSLAASGAVIGADARLGRGFVAQGGVKLVNARIGGDLDCGGATFDFPGEESLTADGAIVSGSVFMDAQTRTTGLLRFVQAKLTQGLFIDGTMLDRGGVHRAWQNAVSADELGADVCGLYLASADVGGTFYLKNLRVEGAGARTAWFSARNGRAGTIEDDLESWDRLDRIDLRDCDYALINGLSDSETARRLARLDREYAPVLTGPNRRSVAWTMFKEVLFHGALGPASRAASLRFVPQPYLQLAQVFRRAGFDGAARDILVRLERNRTVLGGYSASRQIVRGLQDALLRYGFSPFRPVLFLLIWIAISTAVFRAEWHSGALVRAKENDVPAQTTTPRPPPQPHASRPIGFEPVIYAMDTLIPLVDLNQKKNFVHPHPSWFVVFNSFLGWLLTSFFAAGVGGLLRKGD